MPHVSKSVYAVGGAVIAAGLMLLANPKTVHAVAAALVQVTNTSSNPVVTQGISQQAAQIVELWCYGGSSCEQILPSSLEGGSYTVPAGQSLVITSADVAAYAGDYPFTPQPCGGFSEVDFASGGVVREAYFLSPNAGTQHFTYPAGIVIPPGATPSSQLEANVSGCGMRLELHGYLTAN